MASGGIYTVSGSDLLKRTGRRTVRGGGRGQARPQATVLGSGDMDRIRAMAHGDAASGTTTRGGRSMRDIAADEARRSHRFGARATRRKAKIEQLEAKRESAQPLTVLEQEDAESKQQYRVKAKYHRDENLDEIKTLRSYGKFATTFTIRDRQLREKVDRKRREQLLDKIHDVEMELHRLKTIKAEIEREKTLRKRQKESRMVIEQQMREREAARQRERKQRQQEAAEAVRKMKAMEEEDHRKQAAKAEEMARRREEVLRANQEAIAMRKRAKEAEREADQRLAEQQRQADEEKIAQAVAEELEKQRREDELFKVRGQMAKMADKREAMDALRAKRAFEAGQRAARQQDLEKARKKRQAVEELRRERQKQMEVKELMRAMEIQQDREEFESNMRARREWMQAEQDRRERIRRGNLKHNKGIRSQMDERATMRRAAREAKLREGGGDEDDKQARLRHVRRLRDRQLKEMRAAGVDSKYLGQVSRYDPERVLQIDYKLGPKGAGRSATGN